MTNTRMLTRRSVMFVKTETTYDTDPTPVEGTNAILALDVDIKEVREKVERPVQQKFLGIRPSVLGSQNVEITFKIELQGEGNAGTPPRQGTLLLACAMDETVVSSTSVTYEPVSSSHSSCTIYLYKDGRRNIITGCRGSVKLIAEAGKIGILEFTMRGRYAAPTATALPAPTYETTIPPVCKGGAFTFDSKTTLCVGLLEVDLANVLANRMCLSDSNAIAGFEITDRNPSATINPESQVETSYTFRADQLTTQRQISQVIGGTAGNIITVTVPKFNIESIEYGDNEGVLIEQITGECAINSGDDEIAIAYT